MLFTGFKSFYQNIFVPVSFKAPEVSDWQSHRRALKQTTRRTQIKAFALFILYQYCGSLKLKEGGKKKTKRPKLWLDTKPRSSFCHLYQDFVETFTLKMGMIQTGLLVRFGHRPLNKFQLKQSRRTSRQKSII